MILQTKSKVETQKAAHKVQAVLCANRLGDLGDASFTTTGLSPRRRAASASLSSEGTHRLITTGHLSDQAKRNRVSSMSTPRKTAGEFLTGLNVNPETLSALSAPGGGGGSAAGSSGGRAGGGHGGMSPLAGRKAGGGGGRGIGGFGGASAAGAAIYDEPKTVFKMGDHSADTSSAKLACATKDRPRVKASRRPPTRARTRAKGTRVGGISGGGGSVAASRASMVSPIAEAPESSVARAAAEPGPVLVPPSKIKSFFPPPNPGALAMAAAAAVAKGSLSPKVAKRPAKVVAKQPPLPSSSKPRPRTRINSSVASEDDVRSRISSVSSTASAGSGAGDVRNGSTASNLGPERANAAKIVLDGSGGGGAGGGSGDGESASDDPVTSAGSEGIVQPPPLPPSSSVAPPSGPPPAGPPPNAKPRPPVPGGKPKLAQAVVNINNSKMLPEDKGSAEV